MKPKTTDNAMTDGCRAVRSRQDTLSYKQAEEGAMGRQTARQPLIREPLANPRMGSPLQSPAARSGCLVGSPITPSRAVGGSADMAKYERSGSPFGRLPRVSTPRGLTQTADAWIAKVYYCWLLCCVVGE